MGRGRRFALAVGATLGMLALGAAPAEAAGLKRLFTVNGTTAQAVGMARSPNGSLHLIFQTFAGRAFSGLAAESISASGSPGPVIQATTWVAGQPGLLSYPNGTLQAFFAATSPGNVASVWGMTSSNGGATWSSPGDVKSSSNTSAAFASDITAVLSVGAPVISLPQAGNLVIQRGLGPSAPTTVVTNSNDGATTNADLAVDASTGQVVAGWKSGAHNLVEYMQSVSPTLGKLQAVPGQDRNAIILSGRDNGGGVYGAYTPDNTHVRLLRYGGGSVAVGRRPGTSAKVLSTATGLDRRIWVMWGDDSNGGIALTRSNRAVTRFEPIQDVNSNAFSIWRISGDGRLGPLDLFADEIPNVKNAPPPGEYYARVLPILSASGAVTKIIGKKGKIIGHKLTVTVTDAGDPVSGAKVKIGSVSKTTNAKGVVSFTFGKSVAFVKATVTDAGYQVLSQSFKL